MLCSPRVVNMKTGTNSRADSSWWLCCSSDRVACYCTIISRTEYGPFCRRWLTYDVRSRCCLRVQCVRTTLYRRKHKFFSLVDWGVVFLVDRLIGVLDQRSSMDGGSFTRLNDWLIYWLLIDWSIYLLVDNKIDWLVDWLMMCVLKVDAWRVVIGWLIWLADRSNMLMMFDWLVGWLVGLLVCFGSCWLMMIRWASSYKKGWMHMISPYDKKERQDDAWGRELINKIFPRSLPPQRVRLPLDWHHSIVEHFLNDAELIYLPFTGCRVVSCVSCVLSRLFFQQEFPSFSCTRT